MSFEGYYQLVCENGHLDSCDALMADPFEEYECLDCKAPLAWWNLVDETNGSHMDGKRIDGYIDLEEDVPAKTEICKCCGHVKTLEEETYKIPEKGGHRVIHPDKETDGREDQDA